MLTETKANGAAAPSGGPAAALQPDPPAAKKANPPGRIDARLIDNVGVTLEAYLGGARMTVAELTDLKADSVVPLDAALNQAVELRLNGVPVARGELVAVGDKFGVRLIEMAG
jgi:flagellar motor switch protein FliN/FliY